MMLLGLHGAARSGKDSTFRFIQEWAEDNQRHAEREAFADRLKMSAMLALGQRGSRERLVALADDLKEGGHVAHFLGTRRKEITGREFLQFYGTEGHRQVFGHDFWVDAVLPNSQEELSDRYFTDLLVITDVRFDNEGERIKQLGGSIWELVRPDIEINESKHASEMRLADELIDRTIINDQSLNHLRDLVASLLDRSVYV